MGIVGGGWQNTSVANCIGHGSIQVGSNCYGIGGISGCGFGSEYFMGCVAEDVTITVGDGCSYIGGITGYCGGYEPAELGVPVTQVTGCRTKNVTITKLAATEISATSVSGETVSSGDGYTGSCHVDGATLSFRAGIVTGKTDDTPEDPAQTFTGAYHVDGAIVTVTNGIITAVTPDPEPDPEEETPGGEEGDNS